MMAVACFCFGCKGAGGIAAAGIAVARVATEVAVAAATPSHPVEGGYVAAPPPPPPPASPPPEPIAVATPCVELPPAPELPGDAYAVRMAACGRHVIVQDPATGLWREHR